MYYLVKKYTQVSKVQVQVFYSTHEKKQNNILPLFFISLFWNLPHPEVAEHSSQV